MRRKGTQFTEAGVVGLEGLHPSLRGTQVPEVITGRVARHVMERADIVQVKSLTPQDVGVYDDETERGYPWDTVHTRQSHLHVPTLNRYAAGDIPEFDSDYDYDDEPGTSDVPYTPQTYNYADKTWIAEGHHRIVADRLRRR